jgi:hypothetical protein
VQPLFNIAVGTEPRHRFRFVRLVQLPQLDEFFVIPYLPEKTLNSLVIDENKHYFRFSRLGIADQSLGIYILLFCF